MIEQIIIGVCGISSVWLTNDPRANYRRWACVVGLIAQPSWIYSTWKAEQWGVFILAFVYTAGWPRGIWH